MEKTAIEWLIDQLEKYELYSKISFQCLKEIEEAKERDSLEKINNFNDGWMHCEKWFEEKKLLEQAKEMHKQEIIDAYDCGKEQPSSSQLSPIEYYNKTFGK
jgi:hypothetical protein